MGMRSAFVKAASLMLLLLALPRPAFADDFADLVAAEKAFAADASTRGTREAFLAALAPDGVVFAPGPVNGRRVWEARAANKNRLEWTPEVAEVSASGDLGYTSGPWQFTAAGADKPSAFGHFFSFWKKQADGKWMLLADHGVNHAQVPFPAAVLRRGGLGVGTAPTWPVGLAELRSADLLAAGELSSRLVSADFFRLREGRVPDGRAEGAALDSATLRLDAGLAISRGGDMAFTWGGGDGSPAWMRVWRRPSAEDAPGHGWTLAADLGVPAAGAAR